MKSSEQRVHGTIVTPNEVVERWLCATASLSIWIGRPYSRNEITRSTTCGSCPRILRTLRVRVEFLACPLLGIVDRSPACDMMGLSLIHI